MEEKLKSIINYYGPRHQLKKLTEETFEFIEEVLDIVIRMEEPNSIITFKHDIEHVTEEIADIENILEQFKAALILDAEKIKQYKEYKVNRQLERIENELKTKYEV